MRQGTTAEVRLDQGKATSSSAARTAILGLRSPGHPSWRDIWLCRRPKSETMALVGTGIRRMAGKTAAT